jgi:hypothetical protein
MQSLWEKAQVKRKEELDLVKSMMNKEKVQEMKRKAQLQSEMAHAFKRVDQGRGRSSHLKRGMRIFARSFYLVAG